MVTVMCFGQRVQAWDKTSDVAAYILRQVLGLLRVPTCMHKTAQRSWELSLPCRIPGGVLNGWNWRISLVSHTNEIIGFFFFFFSEGKLGLHLLSIVL